MPVFGSGGPQVNFPCATGYDADTSRGGAPHREIIYTTLCEPCQVKLSNVQIFLIFFLLHYDGILFSLRFALLNTQKNLTKLVFATIIIPAIFWERWSEMNQKTELVRSLKFLLFSISAGLIEIASFAILNETLGWPYWPCYLIALVLSVLWNFTLNRRYTFRSASNVPKAMFLVFLFYLVFTPGSTLLGNWLAEDLHWDEYLVTAINMALNFVLEFLYDRFIVFRDSIDTNSIAKKQAARNQ